MARAVTPWVLFLVALDAASVFSWQVVDKPELERSSIQKVQPRSASATALIGHQRQHRELPPAILKSIAAEAAAMATANIVNANPKPPDMAPRSEKPRKSPQPPKNIFTTTTHAGQRASGAAWWFGLPSSTTTTTTTVSTTQASTTASSIVANWIKQRTKSTETDAHASHSENYGDDVPTTRSDPSTHLDSLAPLVRQHTGTNSMHAGAAGKDSTIPARPPSPAPAPVQAAARSEQRASSRDAVVLRGSLGSESVEKLGILGSSKSNAPASTMTNSTVNTTANATANVNTSVDANASVWTARSSLAPREYNNYKYLGCYVVSNVESKVEKHLSSLTPSRCFTRCKLERGAKWFALRDGRECSCFNVVVRESSDETSCNAPCTGDSHQLCGGKDLVHESVYVMVGCD